MNCPAAREEKRLVRIIADVLTNIEIYRHFGLLGLN